MKAHDAENELELAMRACTPILSLVCWDEDRAVDVVRACASRQGRRVHVWSHARGLDTGRTLRAPGELHDPVSLLDFVTSREERAVYVLLDAHPFFSSPLFVRKLKDAADALAAGGACVVLVSATQQVPVELSRHVVSLQLPPADTATLSRAIAQFLSRAPGREKVTLDASLLESFARACAGMTLREVAQATARVLVECSTLDARAVALLHREKQRAFQSTGILHPVEASEDLGDVGGLEVLKRWVESRAAAFTSRAQSYGLPPPRGLLLTGVQGSGKSLSARATADALKLPLYRMDVAAVYAGLVGASESNLRHALRTAEATSPCVLWIDEIDKALAGAVGSAGDGGTSSRIFGTLLTWLQEKQSPVFVVATANAVETLPPELLRRGRFDEIFFVDLPGPAERLEIATIHLRKRGRAPNTFDLESIARASEGMSGAEIEQAIIAGLFHSFAEDRPLETRDVLRALREIVPLTAIAQEQIEALRKWSSGRARNASASTTHPGRRIAV